jgi:hypothetical protein
MAGKINELSEQFAPTMASHSSSIHSTDEPSLSS